MSSISLNNPSINSAPVSNFSKISKKISASVASVVKAGKDEVISLVVKAILFVICKILPAPKALKGKVLAMNTRQIQATLDARDTQELPSRQSPVKLVLEMRGIELEKAKQKLAALK
jgi:hypothetical protein